MKKSKGGKMMIPTKKGTNLKLRKAKASKKGF